MNKRTENQINGMLRAVKRRRWHVALLVCLALVVTAGVAGIFHLPAIAKTYQVTELTCTAVPPEGEAYANFFVHIHNDVDCYDAAGNLVCPLPEIRPHRHTSDCYTTTRTLVCTIQESDGHQHTENCYTRVRGDLICEESTDPILDEEGNVLKEGHVHTDECFAWTEKLSCGLEAGQGAHHHDDSCFETNTTLICEQPEVLLHTHTDACYQKNEDGSIYVDEDGNTWLICGQLQVTEHVHGPECFTTYELDDGEPEAVSPEAEAQAEENNNQETETSNSDEIDSDNTDPADGNTADDAAENTALNTDKEIATETVEETASVSMPAQNFYGVTDEVEVFVMAPEGAFPARTTMYISAVPQEDVIGALNEAANGAMVRNVQAVDISFRNADGEEIEPLLPISVKMSRISQEKPAAAETAAEAKESVVLHVENDGSAQIVGNANVTDTEAEFESDSFSTYIMADFLTEEYIASNGDNYHISVTYGTAAGIPENADLNVEELTESSSSYETYVASTESALGMEEGSAGYIRLFDISIVDKNDPTIRYQPAEGTTVDVKIELADSNSETLSVVHFVDENSAGDIVTAETDGQNVSFAAEGFSVYAVVDTADTDPSGTVSRKYEFYTDNSFSTPYLFLNKKGELTSVQYVTEGGMLYNPDAPAQVMDGKQFVGWADGSGTIIIAPTTEGTAITGVTGTNTVVKLYPRYDDVYYLEYYDEHHNVYKTESSVNGDFTMTGMTADLKDGEDYRITYQPDDSEEAFMGWSLEDHSLNTVTQVDFTGDADRKIELYPAKAKVFWINFDKNDAGGTSKATYTAPVWVLQTDDKVSDRHTSLPESSRPGYEFGGWYTDPECTAAFNMDTHLTGDITLYANWIPAGQTYTVVILKQRISDSVTATAAEKTYDYETSYAIHGTTGSTASVPNQYKNLNFDGFNYARCDANSTIAADGSTVLYVYYDRKIITFNFYLYGSTGTTTNYTVISRNDADLAYNSGTIYGDYNGEKVELTCTTTTTTSRYLSAQNRNNADPYEGTVYEYIGGWNYSEASEPYNQNTTYYRYYYNSWWDNGFTRLYWVNGQTTTYTWYTPDGNEYNGTFYRQTQTQPGTRWYIWKSMTGLYGSSLNGEWPSEYWWYSSYSGSTGNGTRTTFLDAFLPSGTSTEVNFYGNTGSGTSTIRFYQQNVDGETYSLPSGGTVTSTNNASFNLTDKYNGFHIAEYRTRRNGAWSSWIQPGELMEQNGNYYYDADPTRSGYQSISSGFSDLEIRYDRNTYTIDFLDGFNHSNTELADSASVLYGCSLENVNPGAPDITHEGYSFTGWYTDPDCKNLFDFSTETMPANNLVLYAGWEKQRFRIWVQPNGGILSPTESTFFRADYGELVQEYSDVELAGRDYYASDDGEYSYIYICDPENHDQARVAYYKKTSELGVITLQKEDENGNVINDVYDEREWTDGKKYSYQKGVYDFVGWYRVDEEISELTPPAILESDALTLWNFNTPVKEPLAIRAIWKRVGSFRVGYDKNMYDEAGKVIVLPGADNAVVPPTTLYTYGDLSQAIVGEAPTKVPENYTFVGWKTPAGEIVQPNDTITIHSSLASLEDGTDTSEPKYIYTLTAVYKQLGVTSLIYDANGGTGTLTDLNGTAAESEKAVYGDNEITDLELNSKLNLSNGAGFIRENYKLIGWNDNEEAADQEVVKYEPGGTYGIDNPEGNKLYAVWELLRMPVPFIKQGEKDDGTYEQLPGAVFQLFTDEACTELINVNDTYSNIIKAADAIVSSTDAEGTNVTFPKVPVGTFYFKETSVGNDYKLDSSVHRITVSESSDGEHTLSYTIDDVYTAGEPLVIKNYRKGTLVVTKTVDSVVQSDSTKEFSFTATVRDGSGNTDTTVSGEFGDMTFENGVASFSLAHGGEKKIRNLVGKTISIKENNAEVYTTTATANKGSFSSENKTYTIAIPEEGDTVAFANKLEGIPVKIIKIDQNGRPLEGATFDFIGPDFDGKDDSTTWTSRKENADSTEAIVVEHAAVPVGTYTLRETITPGGYNVLAGDVVITLQPSDTDHDITISVSIGGTQVDTSRIKRDTATGLRTIEIMNSTGYELPSTGGPGTALFTAIGGIMTALAGAVLSLRKRKEHA